MAAGWNQSLAERRKGSVDASHEVLQPRRDGPASEFIRRTAAEDDPQRPAVELRGVSLHYKGVAALNGIDLAIRPGEFFSLLGSSGCGKTSTLNVIGGFIEPGTGDILIEGRSMRNVPAHRRPVNTVFQSYALFPHMTVAENIGFGPRMNGKTRTEIGSLVEDALRLVSLVGMQERRPNQLSGGQQQRVALARALVNRPSVLLLDEPLGALDLKLRKQMQLELSRIQREVGITFVYVTHDQEEAMTMSDRIAVMDKGSVVQVGTPKEIYERPISLFVADFIGASNVLAGEIVAVEQDLAHVRLDAGVVIRVKASVPKLRRVSVVVRPDHMRLAATAPDGARENSVIGRVSKAAFLGTHLQVALRLDNGQEIAITRNFSEAENQSNFAIGDSVHVTWPIARSLCFASGTEHVKEANPSPR